MTCPADVKRLLDRKAAKLTALIDADKLVVDAEQAIVDLINSQRSAYQAALASGWSADELSELGLQRRRRLYHLQKKLAPGNAGGHRNGAKNPDGAPPEIPKLS